MCCRHRASTLFSHLGHFSCFSFFFFILFFPLPVVVVVVVVVFWFFFLVFVLEFLILFWKGLGLWVSRKRLNYL